MPLGPRVPGVHGPSRGVGLMIDCRVGVMTANILPKYVECNPLMSHHIENEGRKEHFKETCNCFNAWTAADWEEIGGHTCRVPFARIPRLEGALSQPPRSLKFAVFPLTNPLASLPPLLRSGCV